MKIAIKATALTAMLLLVGCEDRQLGRADAAICQPFSAAPVNTGAIGGEASNLDDCLHRTGYRLARASDPADIVAQATVSACGDALSRWNQQAVSQPATAGAADAAVDLVTGQSISQLAQRYQYAQGRALYYVVQGRAGRCDVPPAPAAAPR